MRRSQWVKPPAQSICNIVFVDFNSAGIQTFVNIPLHRMPCGTMVVQACTSMVELNSPKKGPGIVVYTRGLYIDVINGRFILPSHSHLKQHIFYNPFNASPA